MNKVNAIMMTKKNMVMLPECEKHVPFTSAKTVSVAEACTMVSKMLSVGYVPDAMLYNWLTTADRTTAIDIYNDIMDNIKEMVGVRNYRPMYRNFPEQVMAMSDVELFVNAIVHYLTSGELVPMQNELKRQGLDESKIKKPTVLTIGKVEDFRSLVVNLITAKTSTSADDKDIVATYFENYGGIDLSSLEIPHKENKAFAYALALKNGYVIKTNDAKKHFNTATDILRLIVAMSDGDVSLAENTKFRSFKRAERRMLMGMMNRLNPKYAVLDMQAYAGQWKRIGERIHPAEYPKYSVANQLFNHVRKGLHEDTIAHKVNCCVSMGKVGIAAELISSKPGEFARNLDRFLRNAESHVEALGVIGMFSEVATKVSVPVLLQVKSHFENRIKDTTSNGAITVQTKVYLPKGNVAKAYAEVDKEIKVIPARLCKSIIDICENAITKQFAEKEGLGKVYISKDMYDYVMPMTQRSASKALKTIPRGSKVKISDDTKIIRSFIWWKNGSGSTDIDLSALMLDKDFNYVGHVSYTNLRYGSSYGDSSYYASVHSGDIVDAPDGASEFIDIDIDAMKKQNSNVRYIVTNVFSYTKQNFCDLPECFAGWMERSELGQYGEIFDARTVINKFDLNAKGLAAVPMVFDMEKREFTWVDLVMAGRKNLSNVESKGNNITKLIQGIVTTIKPSMGEVIELNAKARGEVVDTIEDADVVFALEGTEVKEGVTLVTQYDLDVLMSDYL